VNKISFRRPAQPPWPVLILALLALAPALQGAEARPDRPGLPDPVASYEMTASLDADEHLIEGRTRLTWTNPAATPVADLCFHLYLNAFRNSASSWLRREGAEDVETLRDGGWGWTEVLSLEAQGGDLVDGLTFEAPDDANPEDRTVARVALPRPVAPGETLEVDLAWLSRLPRAVARTGYRRDYHLAAQWFPKLGVMEPDGRWNCHQFHHSSEFFADYGDYDVSLTVPEDFVVGATGRRVEETPDPKAGTTTYRYVQEGVHDFAWTAWPGFLELTRTFEHPTLPPVEVHILTGRDKARFMARYWRALESSLRLFGEWYGPYPYPTLTMVDPPHGAGATGGMEYPTFITTGTDFFSTLLSQRPEGVTVHEFGHQYFYGLLGSDEVQESWLDEGINTYASARVMDAAYGPRTWTWEAWGLPLSFSGIHLEHPLDTSARYFRRPDTDPVVRTTWGYLDHGAFRFQTYSKTSLALAQLENLVGREAMDRAMREYVDEYRFRHPRSGDFVRSLSRSLGRDLTPYFARTVGSSDVLDYAVDKVASRPRRGPVGVFGRGDSRQTVEAAESLEGYESEVVVRRMGGVRLPVVVEMVFTDGQRARVRWDGEERWVRFRVTGPRLAWAEVDPDQALVLDVDRLNNSLRVEPDPRASRRWGQRVRFWIQNVLETMALLGWAGGTP